MTSIPSSLHRSGTVPAPLVVGLGEACRIAQQEMAYDHEWVCKLSKKLVDTITSRTPHVIRNGDPEHSYPGCVNLSFAYVEGGCGCPGREGHRRYIFTSFLFDFSSYSYFFASTINITKDKKHHVGLLLYLCPVQKDLAS